MLTIEERKEMLCIDFEVYRCFTIIAVLICLGFVDGDYPFVAKRIDANSMEHQKITIFYSIDSKLVVDYVKL